MEELKPASSGILPFDRAPSLLNSQTYVLKTHFHQHKGPEYTWFCKTMSLFQAGLNAKSSKAGSVHPKFPMDTSNW